MECSVDQSFGPEERANARLLPPNAWSWHPILSSSVLCLCHINQAFAYPQSGWTERCITKRGCPWPPAVALCLPTLIASRRTFVLVIASRRRSPCSSPHIRQVKPTHTTKYRASLCHAHALIHHTVWVAELVNKAPLRPTARISCILLLRFPVPAS